MDRYQLNLEGDWEDQLPAVDEQQRQFEERIEQAEVELKFDEDVPF